MFYGQMLLHGEKIRQQLGGVELMVRPFHTGTPAYSASVSTISYHSRDTEYRHTCDQARGQCLNRLFMTNLAAAWAEISNASTWSYAATSKEHRVRVESFSKRARCFYQ